MKLLNSCYNYLIIFYLLTHAQLPYDVSFIVYPPSCWFICFLFVVFFWEYFIFSLLVSFLVPCLGSSGFVLSFLGFAWFFCFFCLIPWFFGWFWLVSSICLVLNCWVCMLLLCVSLFSFLVVSFSVFLSLFHFLFHILSCHVLLGVSSISLVFNCWVCMLLWYDFGF